MHLITSAGNFAGGNFRGELGKIQNISKQFLDDVDGIIDKFKDDAFVMACLDSLVSEV